MFPHWVSSNRCGLNTEGATLFFSIFQASDECIWIQVDLSFGGKEEELFTITTQLELLQVEAEKFT